MRVFENRVLRRIFWPERDKEAGEWGKIHNEEFIDLYSSPNIIWVIKLTRMRWVGHITHMGRGEAYRFLVGKPEGRGHLENPGVDGRIILRWIFRKWEGRAWT